MLNIVVVSEDELFLSRQWIRRDNYNLYTNYIDTNKYYVGIPILNIFWFLLFFFIFFSYDPKHDVQR